MPTVPSVNRLNQGGIQTGVTPLGDPRRSQRLNTSGAFGAEVFDEIAKVGETASRVSDMLMQQQILAQQDDNKREGDKMEVMYSEMTREANKTFFDTRGENTIVERQAHEARLTEIRDKVLGTTKNDLVRERMEFALSGKHEANLTSADKYVRQQRMVANADNTQAVLASVAEEVSSNYGSEAIAATGRERIGAELADQADREGWSAEKLVFERQKETDKTLEGAVDRALAENPSVAREVYERQKDFLSAEAETRVLGKLKNSTIQQESLVIVTDALELQEKNKWTDAETLEFIEGKTDHRAVLLDKSVARWSAVRARRVALETATILPRAVKNRDRIVSATKDPVIQIEMARKLNPKLQRAVIKLLDEDQTRIAKTLTQQRTIQDRTDAEGAEELGKDAYEKSLGSVHPRQVGMALLEGLKDGKRNVKFKAAVEGFKRRMAAKKGDRTDQITEAKEASANLTRNERAEARDIQRNIEQFTSTVILGEGGTAADPVNGRKKTLKIVEDTNRKHHTEGGFQSPREYIAHRDAVNAFFNKQSANSKKAIDAGARAEMANMPPEIANGTVAQQQAYIRTVDNPALIPRMMEIANDRMAQRTKVRNEYEAEVVRDMWARAANGDTYDQIVDAMATQRDGRRRLEALQPFKKKLRAHTTAMLEGRRFAQIDDPKSEEELRAFSPEQLSQVDLNQYKTRLTKETEMKWEGRIFGSKARLVSKIEHSGAYATATRFVKQLAAGPKRPGKAQRRTMSAEEEKALQTDGWAFVAKTIEETQKAPPPPEIEAHLRRMMQDVETDKSFPASLFIADNTRAEIAVAYRAGDRTLFEKHFSAQMETVTALNKSLGAPDLSLVQTQAIELALINGQYDAVIRSMNKRKAVRKTAK